MDYSDTARILAPALGSYFPSFTVDNIGTWTPNWAGSAVAGTYAYPTATGVWSRLGNVVIIHGNLKISAIGVGPAGAMWIVGLPFVASNNVSILPAVSFAFISNINYTNTAYQLTGLVRANTANIELFESFDNAAGASYPAANFTNPAAEVIFSAAYQVD
jgi:hypothetical protein